MMRSLLLAIYGVLIRIYDRITAKECELSIGDFMLKRSSIDYCQFTVATRLLDVRHYFDTGRADFPYQNMVSRKLWGENHEEDTGNRNFLSLINSFKSKGFDIDSCLEVDLHFLLINGTHRAACCLYFNNSFIRVVRLARSISKNNTPLSIYNMGLRTEFIGEIIKEFELIQKQLIESGNTFLALMDDSVYDEIMTEFPTLVNILKINSFVSSELRLNKGKMIQFSLFLPNYTIKNGVVHSEYASRLKSDYESRFGSSKIVISTSCFEGKKLFDKLVVQ